MTRPHDPRQGSESWGAFVLGDDGIPIERSPVLYTKAEAEAWAESRRDGRHEVLVRNWTRFTEWADGIAPGPRDLPE